MKNVRVQKLGFPGRDPGSSRYREVREAHRNRFHLFSSILVSVARSYDQKSKKVNDYQINDYFNVSIGAFHRDIQGCRRICPYFSTTLRALNDSFLAAFRRIERVRELREAYRKRFHLSWYL